MVFVINTIVSGTIFHVLIYYQFGSINHIYGGQLDVINCVYKVQVTTFLFYISGLLNDIQDVGLKTLVISIIIKNLALVPLYTYAHG